MGQDQRFAAHYEHCGIVGQAACGWVVGQCLHPAFPHNFRLLWVQNITVLTKATAGEQALRSQIGSELLPMESRLVPDQWPALLAAAVLVYLLATRPGWRRPQVLLIAGLALLALLSGLFLWLRFFELAAPLTLLAIAVGSLSPGSPARPRMTKAALVGIFALILAPYIVVYRVKPDCIEVVAVIHGSRRWPRP